MTNLISYDDGAVIVNEGVRGSVQFGDWVTFDDHTAFWRKHQFRLTPQEHRLLEKLVLHGGHVCTKQNILSYLETDADYKIADVIFCKLKRKIRSVSPEAAEELKTFWGRGYGCMRPGFVEPPWCPILPKSMEITGSYPQRWTPSLKRMVVSAIKNGKCDRTEFLELNRMDDEELREWEAGMVKITDLL
jgi:hypothetical protein